MTTVLAATLLACLLGCVVEGDQDETVAANLSSGEWQAYNGLALGAGRDYVLSKVVPDYSHVIEVTDHKAEVTSLKATRGEGEQPDQMDTFMFTDAGMFVFTSYNETTRAAAEQALVSLVEAYGEPQTEFPPAIEEYSIYGELANYLANEQLNLVNWFAEESQWLMVAITTKVEESEEVAEDTAADDTAVEEAAEPEPDDSAILLIYLFDLPTIEGNYEAFTILQ